MRRQKVLARLAAAAGLLWTAACGDVPTNPAPAPLPAAMALDQGLHAGQVPVVCSLGAARISAVGFGWYRRQDTLYVPRPEADPAGRTVQYRFSANNGDGVMAFGASCPAVPYTEAALRRVDRRFLVRENGGAAEFKQRQGTIMIQGCVTDGVCPLEPITVTVRP
ncbi:MAG TPA: hypothetical protein VF665_22905 [Longimicrobium sp.]|jgi:hypothetical protein|uniref:hypothetical protein n=1 Tax=Longimicrobium sp. TaxID=2029185 RepID=UPI002EDB2FB4